MSNLFARFLLQEIIIIIIKKKKIIIIIIIIIIITNCKRISAMYMYLDYASSVSLS